MLEYCESRPMLIDVLKVLLNEGSDVWGLPPNQ
jgi:hypothetical protein